MGLLYLSKSQWSNAVFHWAEKTLYTVAVFCIYLLPWSSQRKTLFLSILKSDYGHVISVIQWEGMEVILCHFPDEGLQFSLAPGIRSEQSKRRLLWNSSVGVEDLRGHALWTSKILCYRKPLRSKRRLSPNHVLSRSYLIMCNLRNFCVATQTQENKFSLTTLVSFKRKIRP